MQRKMTQVNPFDIFTATRMSSPALERIWQEAYGTEYAYEARPNAFYPKSVLDSIVRFIGETAAGGQILDIGCGHGLAGRYLARMLRVKSYCGIDNSPRSISLAKEQLSKETPTSPQHFDFSVADATSTGLDNGSCAAVICLDVLIYFRHKSIAMREIFRVLRPGGIFAFTTWEQVSDHNARLDAEQFQDYRPLLQEAGFIVRVYEEVDQWREMQGLVFTNITKAKEQLDVEIGEEAASMWTSMAEGGQREMDGRRYVFGIAQRPDEIEAR